MDELSEARTGPAAERVEAGHEGHGGHNPAGAVVVFPVGAAVVGDGVVLVGVGVGVGVGLGVVLVGVGVGVGVDVVLVGVGVGVAFVVVALADGFADVRAGVGAVARADALGVALAGTAHVTE